LNLFSILAYSQQTSKPSISIIIDDLGYKQKEDILALSLPGPIAYAILPHAPYTKKIATIASQNGKEILLHQPMQALENNDLLGPGALTLNMTQKEFVKTLETNISVISNIIGINNHMGSLLTRHPGHMQWLMNVLKKNEYIYVDSLTSTNSVAGEIAKKNKIPFLKRDIFLDNNTDLEYITKKFFELIALAKKEGTALAIAHPHSNTIKILSEFLQDIDAYGVKLIGVKSLIKIRNNK
tara:strand:+ start:3155 stop:3871 length:717 start_codon:yes stop_codon:yes gene_type:complete